jgi:hypothetical protein
MARRKLFFVVGALIGIASQRHGGANFAAIYDRCAYLHRLTKAWGTNFAAVCDKCDHLHRLAKAWGEPIFQLFVVGTLRLLASPYEDMGDLLFLLFVIGVLICNAPQKHGGATFAAICEKRAHVHHLTKAWGINFCCYLW